MYIYSNDWSRSKDSGTAIAHDHKPFERSKKDSLINVAKGIFQLVNIQVVAEATSFRGIRPGYINIEN